MSTTQSWLWKSDTRVRGTRQLQAGPRTTAQCHFPLSLSPEDVSQATGEEGGYANVSFYHTFHASSSSEDVGEMKGNVRWDEGKRRQEWGRRFGTAEVHCVLLTRVTEVTSMGPFIHDCARDLSNTLWKSWIIIYNSTHTLPDTPVSFSDMVASHPSWCV